MSKIYWIENKNSAPSIGRLAIVARPRGGDWLSEELQSLTKQGINVLVSFLESHEQTELGLTEEASMAQEYNLEYHNFPIPDRQIPDSLLEAQTFVQQMAKCLREGKNVGVHCRQSVGRSGFIAAAILFEQGMEIDDAFVAIEEARGCSVPDTEEQRQWVAKYARLKDMAFVL